MLDRILPPERRLSFMMTMLLLAFTIAATAIAYQYRAIARAFPLIIGYAMCILCILDLVMQTETAPGRVLRTFFTGKKADDRELLDEMETEKPDKDMFHGTLFGIVWVWVFMVVVYVIGFLPTIPIYTYISMKKFGGYSQQKALLSAFGLLAIVWLFFDVTLGFTLFQGVLYEWLVE